MLKVFCAALAFVLGAPAFAADTISATHVFPASLIYSRSFLEFVKKANEAGKGEFTIQVRGGPEAIPFMEQPGAVRSGVVDMVYTPCAFYAAQVPECDAVAASTIDGPTARKNGGTDLLNQIHEKRIGVYDLGWVDSGIRFNLWSTKEPKLDSSGHIDIKGFKVRGNPIYNAFLTNYLGAQVINLPSTELFTALIYSAYLTRVAGYSGEHMAWDAETIRGDAASVKARVVAKDGDVTPVEFYLLRGSDGRWRVWDASFEGMSLVGNYRAQFARIM